MKGSLLYGPDDRPPFLETVLLSWQHLILVFGSYIMPAIVARAAGLPPETAAWTLFASLLAGALASFVQARPWGPLGSGFLVMMCCSSAYMVCTVEAARVGGMALAATLTVLAAPLEFVLGARLRKIRQILSPSISGIIVLLVGVTILPLALELWKGMGNGDMKTNLMLGLLTMALTLCCSKIRWCSVLAPALGIAGGCAAAWWTGSLDLSSVMAAPLFGLPSFHWPGLAVPKWEHLPLFAAFLLATLASSAESIANSITVQRLSCPQKPIDYRKVRGGLWADAAGSIASAFMGGLPNTTGAGNIAAIGFTGAASRRIGIGASILLGLMAFSPRLSGLIMKIPAPVLAGISILLAMGILGTGFWMISQEAADSRLRTILGAALTVGILSATGKFFPELLPQSLSTFLRSPIAAGGSTVLLLGGLRVLHAPKKITLTPSCPVRFADLAGALASFPLTNKELLTLELLLSSQTGKKELTLLRRGTRLQGTLSPFLGEAPPLFDVLLMRWEISCGSSLKFRLKDEY